MGIVRGEKSLKWRILLRQVRRLLKKLIKILEKFPV
jgi:hypothetical protein